MSEGRKRADDVFYLGPDFKNPCFFVEAKKPSVEIANKDSYFQALRYGWNGGTPLAVLTDFEQFHILDSRARPDIDTALSRAVQKYHYTDYADRDKFGAIYWLFSREAVAAGGLKTYVASQMPKAPASSSSAACSTAATRALMRASCASLTSTAGHSPAPSTLQTPLWTARR